MSGGMFDDLEIGQHNTILGGEQNDVLHGTILNDTIIGGAGADVIYGDTSGNLETIGTIETFDTTYSGRGFATFASGYLGEWYAPDGYSILDVSEYNVPDEGHGQTIELATDQNTSISRRIDEVEDGQEFVFSFDMALPEHNRTPGEDGVRVIWNGEVIGVFSPDQYNVWETISLNLIAGSGDGSNTLTLEGTGESDWWGALIDNLSLVVPNVPDGGNDYLVGGADDDLIYGGAGRDWLEGGTGADQMIGGEGVDTVTYMNAESAVTVHLGKGVGTRGEARGDTYVDIENVHGSAYDDVLKGSSGTNRLVGRDGDDKISAGGGDDYLVGGRGADVLNGGGGRDTAEYDWSTAGVTVNLTTGTGQGGYAEGDVLKKIENLKGSLHDDTLTGDDNVNRLNGLSGDDVLIGMGGNDIMIGGLGADTLIGGDGDRDAADYENAAEGVGVDLVEGGFGGEATGDTYDSVEFVYGSNFDDAISGDDGVNRLVGRDGDDVLFGAGGNDYIMGGAGDDSIMGGEGDDVFLYKEMLSGADTIYGFEAGAGRTDRIWIDISTITSMSDLVLSDVASGVEIDLGGFGSILLDGLSSDDLVADDFIF